ncbi:restriction endonuclease subunit S [Salmonella enterica subsp. enterica serovar Altendorf]|uniref:restriction endonuclease subunit S n=1 Tax=Salmonella enterica TaxID=28901 RepID=UPI000BA18C46|nr:restriction endonuclease subunit S [Salmonella enterica]OZU10068.1 restriction endonuclease subunit S [Salmonella enterica subsp. enterica serovar Altendorf]
MSNTLTGESIFLKPFSGKIVPLEELCISITDCPHSTPNWTNEGLIVIRNFNIKNGSLDLSKPSYTDKDSFAERIKMAKPEPGDIIITREAPMGQVCIIPGGVKCCLGQRMVLIKVDTTKISREYLLFALQSEFVQKQIKKSDKTGSIVSNLCIPDLKSLDIPVLDNSDTIVSTLKSVVDKIALNNRINTELEAMAKTLYDHWFVQFDFPDTNGKPYKTSGGKMVYNATLKREIPAGWTVQTLFQIANITMGQSQVGESYNEDGVGTLFFQGSTDFGWLFPSPRQYTTSPARMAKKGDILLSVRAPVVDINITNADCCIGRGLAALNSKSHSDGFLFYVIKYFKQVFDHRNTEGTTFGSITKDDLHSLQVVCPEPELLKRYDDIVTEYNKMIFSRSLENQDLIKLRDWLLPLLMNGQVTVK